MIEAKNEFGMFIIKHRQDIAEDIARHLNLQELDQILELHIPEERKGAKPQILIRMVGNSFRLLAQRLQEQGMVPEYVVGVTYAPLGYAAKIFGFTVERFRTASNEFLSDLSSELRRSTRFEKNPQRDPYVRSLLCYMKGDLFISRFSKPPAMSPRDLLARIG